LQGFYSEVLKSVRSGNCPKTAGIERDDLLGGVAVALVIMLATLPVVAPYVLISNTTRAVRVSEAIAVGLLFLLGHRWGKIVGSNPWGLGAALTLIGGLLVGVTVLLGG
jgi:VIT1/CCC1 family predicted Fe2+/Mn2+ transporter